MVKRFRYKSTTILIDFYSSVDLAIITPILYVSNFVLNHYVVDIHIERRRRKILCFFYVNIGPVYEIFSFTCSSNNYIIVGLSYVLRIPWSVH